MPHIGLFLVLVALGAGWGMSQPLTKIAVSSGHGYLGLIVWQLAMAVALLTPIILIRRKSLPLAPRYLWRYGLIALVGTLIPNSISYQAAVHLPAGVMALIMSLVAMFALPMALGIGMERFSPLRALGVLLGAIAILLLVGPKASLPDPALTIWVLFAAITPFMYAVEGTWVARFGMLDLDATQMLLGASIIGLIVAVPLALTTGQWVDLSQSWAAPEFALLASSVINTTAYVTYLWLIGRAGSVFASQVAYLVTGFGVLWSILLLDEGYSGWVWAAMAVMMAGLFLVTPRSNTPLAERP
ncbi:MAG: DMT family transporter [Alphaproteobacteria bacterium]|nr:DMT family transporter [Alphaproteobacteria bacterium]